MKYIFAKHDIATLTAEFIAEDGSRYLRTGGNPCWRFFNPGNIRPSKTSVCDSLKIGVGTTKSGRFMIFPDEKTGWHALKLLLKITYGGFTVDKVTKVYSPVTDGNNPEDYKNFIIYEAGVNGCDYIRDMDDQTLERVMEAIKKMEGYYNKKDTQKENIVPTTVITVSDGKKPIVNETVKVVTEQCTYEWNTDKFGEVPVIAHLPDRSNLNVLIIGPDGKDEIVYSATMGTESKNILLIKNHQGYIAKTGTHKEGVKSTEDYLVIKGDTLSSVAKKLHTTVKRLADLNKITNINLISVGQKLKVPGGASKPQVVNAQRPSESSHQPVSTGVSDKGYPQANIGNIEEQAPWMKIAFKEGSERWKWGSVTENSGHINYHQETGGSNSTMVGTSNAWCASFINYCLGQAGYMTSGSANSQSFAHSCRFFKIEAPIYGAIAVFHKKGTSSSGHVTFVYCKTKDTEIGVLGGNQKDSVTVNAMKHTYINAKSNFEFIGYFIPAAYKPYADEVIKKGGDLESVYDDITSVRSALGALPISENEDNTR